MIKKEVERYKEKARNFLNDYAKTVSKRPEVQQVIEDIRHHFKTTKNPWHLSFGVYLEMAKIPHIDVFTIILLKNGFKPKFTRNNELVITKAKK